MAESPFRVERVEGGHRFTFDLHAERTERHRKRGIFGAFEMLSAEGPALGGDGSAPPPLANFSAALESDTSHKQISALMAQAERVCFVMDAIQRPHTIARSVTLNGAPFSVTL